MESVATKQYVVDFLNSLLEVDKAGVSALVRARVECNKDMADHPKVTVGYNNGSKERFEFGVLGLLNGLFTGSDNAICFVYDEETGEISNFTTMNEYNDPYLPITEEDIDQLEPLLDSNRVV